MDSLCGDGMSFEELVTSPPSTEQVVSFLKSLRPKADPDGEPDMCLCCLPKSIVCCLPRLCCPCFCKKPDPVSTVKTRDVVATASKAEADSFLGSEKAMKYTAKLFKSKDASECRLEYMSAGMILLSKGSIKDKLQALFDSFAHVVGGVFNRDALEHIVRSLIKTVTDIAERVADMLSGVITPGGKAVKLMMMTLHGTVGSYFVKNRVDKMLSTRDVNQDGSINFDEFYAAAMSRDSLVRKTISWAEHKTAILRHEKELHLTGKIKVNGKEVWARIKDTDVEEDQCLEYWNDKEQLGNKEHVDGVISLQEPCAMDDGQDEDDNIFIIQDAKKQHWTIECETREEFFEWFDAVDDMCDAKLQPGDLEDDAEPMICPTITKMLR